MPVARLHISLEARSKVCFSGAEGLCASGKFFLFFFLRDSGLVSRDQGASKALVRR
jgi:hypothetical protein